MERPENTNAVFIQLPTLVLANRFKGSGFTFSTTQ